MGLLLKMKDFRINVFKTYYDLTKPGIIRGNLLTAAAGFFLASQGHIDSWLLLATLAGTSLVIASGCVLNNYIDRNIDQKMARTSKRALVLGTVSETEALVYATGLNLLGFMILAVYTNTLTVAIGLLAVLFYVVIYGVAKRRSVYGTIVGSIPGAASVVAGYTAVTGQLDMAALLLFVILVAWQIPHFYAIALYRLDDYTAAKLPVMPVAKGVGITKIQILFYISAFTAAAVSLTLFGYTSYVSLVVSTLLGLAWLGLGLKGYRSHDDKRWGRTMFLFSLLVITLLCVTIAIDSFM